MLRITFILIIIMFFGAVLYHPTTSIHGDPITCKAQQFDDLPWISPERKRRDFCGEVPQQNHIYGEQSGRFTTIRHDEFKSLDSTFWAPMSTTFFCNQAMFAPKNISLLPQGGLSLRIERQSIQDRAYTAADLTPNDVSDNKLQFGRVETYFKPIKVPGVISSFFLYRFDPWQEIDAEFLGSDTSKLLVNVYFNPGQEGDLYNYGLRGTPVLINLGFDASLDFHRYAIEWERNEIRWFVDNRLVHVRKNNYPTPIPNLPMNFHVNTWPTCSKELAGEFSPLQQSIAAELKSVTISNWAPPPQNKLVDFISWFEWGKDLAGSDQSNEWRRR
jgi:beta-glucanase (GH16 family)